VRHGGDGDVDKAVDREVISFFPLSLLHHGNRAAEGLVFIESEAIDDVSWSEVGTVAG